jgi:protein gp37
LKKTSARVKFLSLEPLLGPLPDLDAKGINWVIVGGESGPHSRLMKEEWVISIRDHCIENQIPFFFKQWGGTRRKKSGRFLQGRTWDQMPISIADIFEVEIPQSIRTEHIYLESSL